MKALIQRVERCAIRIDGKEHSSIGFGILIFLGVGRSDSERDAVSLAERCAALRILDDAAGTMNLSVRDINGSAMVVSQFTLYGETQKGHRPSYSEAAPPERAEGLYDKFIESLSAVLGREKVASGVFRAMMKVEFVNDGPVTVMVESKP